MRANTIPSIPEIKKRIESTIRGEAALTMILAEVNALDHIKEKVTPYPIDGVVLTIGCDKTTPNNHFRK